MNTSASPNTVEPSEGILRPALTLLIVLSLLTGLLYPLLITAAAQTLFPEAANGSLIRDANGEVIGSALIGQPFSQPGYFWSRPSATSPAAYNGAASSGSNLGPLNPALTDTIQARVQALRIADPSQTAPVPVDLVTSSASGLDPHISAQAALFQLPRVARVRGLSETQVRTLIDAHTEYPLLGVIGEKRVHVLRLNRALDAVVEPAAAPAR